MKQIFAEKKANNIPDRVVDDFDRFHTDYVASLIAAVLIALTAKNPHQRSPAYAVQHARNETCRSGDTDWGWAERFLRMSGSEYKVGWATKGTMWTYGSGLSVSGLIIAQHCLAWLQRDWEFNFHKFDDRLQYDDDEFMEMEAKAKQELAQSDLSCFLLPANGEIVRRVWTSVKGQLRMLDIWKSPGVDQYYYAIRDSGSPEILARSIEPHYPHVLKQLLETELLPSFASRPFVMKAHPSRRLYR